jgi:hypothetical protein
MPVPSAPQRAVSPCPLCVSASRASLVEPLESRRLLSGDVVVAADPADTTGPQLVRMHLVGPNDAVTQVVLTFNERLDPVTAQDTAAYQLLRTIHREEDDDEGLIDNPFDDDGGGSTDVVRVRFASAVYDDATTSVTLTAANPFRADKRFRNLRIAGGEERGLRDVSGNRLDGDADGTAGDPVAMTFKARRGRRLILRDTDGDRATLRLSGPGRMISILHRKRRGGPPDPLIFLERTRPDRTTTLSGAVRPGRNGDGAVDIEQITGIAAANVTFLSDPAFRIGATQP